MNAQNSSKNVYSVRISDHALRNQGRSSVSSIPVLHIDAKWSDNEFAMAKDALETIHEIAEAAGFRVNNTNNKPAPPGFCIHEVGTARMGADSKKSVLNKWNQVWDAPNVFVTDGAAFVSQGCQNPTLTMMAITARACDYLATEANKRNL